MKAVVAKRYGPPEVLHLEEVPTPVPKPDQVRIRIHASTLTAGDCEMRRFDMPLWIWLPARLFVGIWKPRTGIFGQELAGEIDAVGESVTQWKVGDAVFAPTDVRAGAHAEYLCLAADLPIAAKPESMTYAEAAALPVGGLNALHFLRKGKVAAGDKMLIDGAGGSIGTAALQIARSLGAEVTCVDSGEKLDMLRATGADFVIDYTRERFSERGERYDVIFDVAGKNPIRRNLKALRRGGRYLIANPRMSHLLLALWASMTSGKKVMPGLAPYRTEDLVHLVELVEAGKLTSVIDRRYPLERMREAHRYVEAGHKKGNVIVTVAR